jgi:acyl carrier protein
MDDVQIAVFEELRAVAELRGVELSDLSTRQYLVDELGFKSLDLAHLVAALERRLRADPFLEYVPITQVRTVGDLCQAYRGVLAQKQ